MNLELEKLLQRCTVRIAIPGQTGWGTGFVVAPGLILTCAHVVKNLDYDGHALFSRHQEKGSTEAKIVQIAPPLDLALLQFIPSISDLPCVYLDTAIKSGDNLYFFGYPDQDFPSGAPVTGCCEGVTGDVLPLIKFKQAQVRPGMSGSALLNVSTDKVCGIVKFTRDRSSDLGGGAVSTQEILEAFPKLKELQQQFHQEDKRWIELLQVDAGAARSDRSVTIEGDVSGSTIVTGDRNTVNNVTQTGKYNINAQNMSGTHIGDVFHAASQPAEESHHRKLNEVCQNRQAVSDYLKVTLGKLRQYGCLSIQEDINQGSQTFRYAARIEDFELPFKPVNMRGEAFFVFSEFSSVEMQPLRQYSGQALKWARTQISSAAAGRAAYNFRMPAHFCFAVALVDEIDEAMRQAMQTVNPLDHSLDFMWYEVPIIYELNQKRLYFYDQPASFWEKFKGEVVWKPLRDKIRQLLSFSTEEGDV